VESGVARLVGGSPENLAALLEEAYGRGSWADRVGAIENPFGRGDSGEQIARIIVNGFGAPQAEVASGGVGRDE
jgi:UDP-N-acetylglucosamine 2-epimerase